MFNDFLIGVEIKINFYIFVVSYIWLILIKFCFYVRVEKSLYNLGHGEDVEGFFYI